MELRYGYEMEKLKPPCIKLFTKAEACEYQSCTYRHVLPANNEELPESGFVHLKLLEVITPNHFGVDLIAHRQNSGDATVTWSMENGMEKIWTKLSEEMVEHFTTK